MFDFPDGTLRREQDVSRLKLKSAEMRYAEDRTPESREEYLLALKAFAALTMNAELPRELV